MNSAATRTPLSSIFLPKSLPFTPKPETLQMPKTKREAITMRDRSKNRKPLQKGRNLSIEAIQTIQALKRASRKDGHALSQVFDSKFRRLVKFDMMAALRELLRQNECDLALKVFEDIRKEYWYKPQLFLYADMISVYASNDWFETVKLLHFYIKTEGNLEPDLEGFHLLFKTFLNFNLTELVIESYELMKRVECEPDRSMFRTLINGLVLVGEIGFSAVVRQDAEKIYGSLEFLQEEEEEEVTAAPKNFV